MKIPNVGLLLGALSSALFFAGCASITRGTSEQLMVQSEPSNAQVKLSNGFTGLTPVSFTVPRKGDIVVTVSKDGYEPVQIEVKSKLDGKGTAGFLGNALIGGVIGGGIDVATGATLAHLPNPVKVTLQPNQTAQRAPVVRSTVAEVSTVEPAKPATEPAADQKTSGVDSAKQPASGASPDEQSKKT
jgi:hypothetical protein